ncbi:methylated-DNA-[protein]-cysteine S-methyltransferase [Nonlabens dokdonensis]|jgi:methylated-DNA-[protein]-cysteine S-methyltransferase|uniref:Methylated-DNA--protein-cysteine methyltransferase n=2 Tax=Nonlabens dokdonensis TaxID=328515 RepID=L7W8N0_NONDD|nr:methylated-DNA--[protein]-cysteine S-methyltransferase [Nonlabens dokdonensis]AGC78060.1 methylated-DNA--protein-cysteine S-methyltransferase [Nonlabens dokdonensis DSW-6]PZX37125.1 methylated-DNA-[protein]-cysteine S-methyltransferase [Nonlabens dokdonensis]
MSNIITSSYKSPVGELILGVYENKLCLADWKYRKMRDAIDARIIKHLDANFKSGNHELLDQTSQQLDAYFKGDLRNFDLPLLLSGTDFQKSVWNELQSIPYGATCSYISLSRKLKNEKAIRAVASANGANAISIIVPCHRVIGADGSLTGYAGGLPAKKKLLELEGIDLHNGQQRLF